MKTLLNSNLLPIINVGMYDSRLSAENIFDDYCITRDYEEGYIEYTAEQFWENFDNGAYERHIQHLADNFISKTYEYKDIKVTVKAGEIYSPKYYNFSTDNIDLTVTFDKNKLLKFAKEHENAFNNYLKTNYSSYSGFISFTANNFKEWLEKFKENNKNEIGAILSYWFGNIDGIDDESFYDYVIENTCYSEFYKEPIED